MLMLTRRPTEALEITVPPSTEPTTIVVTYLGRNRSNSQARIGVDAPKSTKVLREELARRIEAGEATECAV